MSKAPKHPPEYYTKKLLPVKDIVDKQWRKGRFNRMDMIMRLLCVDEYYANGKKPGRMFKWYRKMQHIRITKIRHIRPDKFPHGFEQRRVRQFIALIESFEKKGYDMSVKGIRLDKDWELANGSHRMAMCIHFKIPEIPVRWPCDSTKVRRGYSVKWFSKKGFPKELIQKLEEKRVEVFNMLELKDRTTNNYI